MKKLLMILSVSGLFVLGSCGSPEKNTAEAAEETTYENSEHEQEAMDLMNEMNAKVEDAVEETEDIGEEMEEFVEEIIEAAGEAAEKAKDVITEAVDTVKAGVIELIE